MSTFGALFQLLTSMGVLFMPIRDMILDFSKSLFNKVDKPYVNSRFSSFFRTLGSKDLQVNSGRPDPEAGFSTQSGVEGLDEKAEPSGESFNESNLTSFYPRNPFFFIFTK